MGRKETQERERAEREENMREKFSKYDLDA